MDFTTDITLNKIFSTIRRFVRITIREFLSDRFFLDDDNWVLDNVYRIANISLRIVQGRYDVICPMRSAWDLHQALPNSDLRIVQQGAHSPLDPAMVDELVRAVEEIT